MSISQGVKTTIQYLFINANDKAIFKGLLTFINNACGMGAKVPGMSEVAILTGRGRDLQLVGCYGTLEPCPFFPNGWTAVQTKISRKGRGTNAKG